MSLQCARARGLIDRRASVLTAGEQLWLEEHLESCAACTASAHTLDAVADTLRASTQILSADARERAMDRAFAEAAGHQTVRPPSSSVTTTQSRWLMSGAIATLAIAAAATIYVAARSGPSTGGAAIETTGAPAESAAQRLDAPALVAPPPRPTAQILAGSVDLDGAALPEGSRWPADAVVGGGAGARFASAHAEIACITPCKLSRDADGTTVTVAGGRAHFEVDPTKHARFRVKTGAFAVEVLGTVFDVDASTVRVEVGHVRVEPESGASADLLAGAEWSLEREAEVGQAASQTLAEARHALAIGDVPRARVLATRAKRAAATSNERAEADTLLAECDRAAGDDAAATRKYEAAARRYAGTPAGETALFAAGRAAADAGDRKRAHALLTEYLSKYPDGRYVDEARRRMNEGDPR